MIQSRFEEIKQNIDKILPEMKILLKDGASDYMYKGANGLCRELFNEEHLELYYSGCKMGFVSGLYPLVGAEARCQ